MSYEDFGDQCEACGEYSTRALPTVEQPDGTFLCWSCILCERQAQLRIIWVDGPDSEAARARTPDPDHVPAVRRVVAWMPQPPYEDETPCLERHEAYAEAADALLMLAWESCRFDIGEGDWWNLWHPQRRHDLAQWLRRRDEEAGHR